MKWVMKVVGCTGDRVMKVVGCTGDRDLKL